MKHKSRMIAIEPRTGPLAIMHYTTVGRGDFLPNGATWLREPNREEPLGWWTRPVTDANIFEQVARAYSGNKVPMPKRYDVLPEDATLPTDRTYRAAWVLRDGQVVEDIALAREHHRARLREARAPRMVELDVAYVRALERTESTAEIVAEKNALREITRHPSIDAAQTIDDLKAVTLGLL